MKAKKMCAIILPPLALIIINLILRHNSNFALMVVNGFSKPLRQFIGTLTSPVPFSVMEAVIAALIIGVVVYIISAIVKSIKSGGFFRRIGRCVFNLLIAALYIATLYVWMFGIDYYIPDFAARNNITSCDITAEKLYNTTKYFAEMANITSENTARNSDSCYTADIDEIFTASHGLYDNLIHHFPELTAPEINPKKMYFSREFSMMGFTGVYFPFFGEANISTHGPLSGLPVTIAHELAHSRGIVPEDEANFVAIAACACCDKPDYEYSGYLMGLKYLLNALYETDIELFSSIALELNENVLADLHESNTYWHEMQSTVTTASTAVYDGYLKSNGQTSGIRSYDECVTLLVQYFTA